MASTFETFNQIQAPAALERWNTRNGTSVRVVKRNQGRFIDNKSARQMLKSQGARQA